MNDPIYPFSNRPLITWDIEYASLTLLEADVNKLRPFVPEELKLLEVRPGVGVFSISLFKYYPWQQGIYEQVYETIFNIHVLPNLKWGVPTVSLFVASFGSNDAQFLADELEHNYFPIYRNSLNFELDAENYVAKCWDENGPVYEIKNPSKKKPIFTKQYIYAQVYVRHEGKVYRSHNTFRGQAYQHQESGDTGIIYDHPFFVGCDVAGAQPPSYLQMLTMPNSDLRQIYYWRPERIDGSVSYEPPVDVKKLTPEQSELLRLITYADNIQRPFRVPIP
jgi:hypothetical protein